MSGQATLNVLEGMSVRNMQRKIFSVAPWDLNEVSTRNCRHCRTDDDCYLVSCVRGNPLTNGKNQSYMYRYIVGNNILIKPCQNCEDFESFKEDI